VKGIALLLAILIFSPSLKASAFVGGLIGAVQGNTSTYSCCMVSDDADIKDCSQSEEDQEKEGCCEGDSCHCLCCLHIAYLQQFSQNSTHLNDFSEVNFNYSFLYQADYLTSVFHPPSVS